MARAGYHAVDLEAGQLSAFAGLCSLRHLDLYLLGIDKIFGGNAKASRSHLFRFAAQGYAVELFMEACRIFAALAGIAARAKCVHCQRKCLMGLLAYCPERNCTGNEVFYYLLYRLNTVYRNRIPFETKKVAQENGIFLVVGLGCELLELLVTAQSRGKLEQTDSLRVPCVELSAFPVRELAYIGQQVARFVRFVGNICISGRMKSHIVVGYLLKSYAADR